MPGRNVASPTGQVQDLLLESKALPDFLLGLTLLAASSLGGTTPFVCAITAQRHGVPAVVASTEDQATRLELLQHRLEEGPSLDALHSQQHVLVRNLQSDGAGGSSPARSPTT